MVALYFNKKEIRRKEDEKAVWVYEAIYISGVCITADDDR